MPRPRLLPVLAAVLALVVTGVSAVAAAPPGDEPLPGYTIVLPELAPLVVDGGRTRILTGVDRGAGYAIEVPPRWNGELVVWAHGFRGNGAELVVDPPSFGLRERFVGQGYAWAASSYDRNGYDVASGVRSSRELTRAFRELVDPPSRTYIGGISMGGHIVARSLEQYPGAYDGALPMCGVLGDHGQFDYLLDYQLTAEALSGVRVYPPGPDYAAAVLPRIYAGLGLAPDVPGVPTPAGQQLRAATVLESGGQRPGAEAAFGYWKDFLFGLGVPAEGPTPVRGIAADPELVAGNVGTDYAPDEPVDLDAIVQRVPVADEQARETGRLDPVAQVFGTPQVPVLTLHGLGDLFVPFSMEQVYAREVAAAGESDLLVQRAIRTIGHCEFSAVEAGAAWDDLVAWVQGGERPDGDDVTDPTTVSDPTYGCAFSDAAAYSTAGPPTEDETRRLFDACPAG